MSTLIQISDNLKIDQLFEEQDQIKDSEKYKEYLDYLRKFFQKDKHQKYDRKYTEDDNYILINRKNEKREIIIEPSRIINLYEYQKEIIENLNEILYQISYLVENFENITDEERQNFDILKNNYIVYRKHLDEIKNIETNFSSKLGKLFDEKIKQLLLLTEQLQNRENIFNLIKAKISIKQKKILMRECKEGLTSLNQDKITVLAKDFQIDNSDVENWIKWIYATKDYILIQKKLDSIQNEIISKTNNYDLNMRQFIYHPPSIEKKKL